jgi:hypothetical protein
MNSKLILVEGLPGFGKSTTARMVQEILLERNVDAALFMEGNLDHPADYDGVACFTEVEFQNLLVSNGEFRDVFEENVFVKNNHYLLPYMKIKNELGREYPDELSKVIFNKDIYELPLEQNIELIVDRWKAFATEAQAGEKVYIFECAFIQNPVTVGMIKYGAPDEQTIDYINQLAAAVKKLNPILFYIQQDDLERAFRKAVDERSEEWFNGFTQYYTNQGYGLQKGLTGLEGSIEVLKARQHFESQILSQLNMKTVTINNSKFDTTRVRLVEALGLIEAERGVL